MNFDPLDTCPYDPVHRILRSRMQFHLTKCAKNFPKSKKRQCPFDARHMINEVEHKYHISTCPARESVIHYKLHDPNALEQHKLLPIENEPAAATVDENWEDDLEVKSYNPSQNTEGRTVFRSLVGAPKSERKKFRKQERLRHSALEEINHKRNKEQTAAKNTSGSKPSNRSEVDPFEDQEKPLRPLKKLPKSLDKSLVGNFSLDKTLDKTQELNRTQEVVVNSSKFDIVKEVTKNKELEKSSDNVKTNQVQKTKFQQALSEEDIAFVPTVPTSLPNQNTSGPNNSVPSTVLNYSYASILNKENSINRSLVNRSINESVIDKLSQTVEDLNVHDEEVSKKAETLDKELESLIKSTNTSFKNARCGAQFSNNSSNH